VSAELIIKKTCETVGDLRDFLDVALLKGAARDDELLEPVTVYVEVPEWLVS
jgi:hypothetical protein